MNKKYNTEKIDEILNRLFSLHRFGINPGLERTAGILELNGNPQNRFKSVHIAGTNGKGSTSSILASIFTEAGYKTGLYTSPHIEKFNERIRINGIDISDQDLVCLAEMYMPYSKEYQCTFFEITTAIAFQYFSENNVDIAFVESGLGGRYDSTNIINPILSIITKIDLDHQEYLGNTIQEIAFEKAGIIKNNTPVIALYQTDTCDILTKGSKEQNSGITFADKLFTVTDFKLDTELDININLKTPESNYEGLKINLTGRHQLDNIKLALAATDKLQKDYIITNSHIRNGLKNIRINTGLRGRIELLRKDPPIILDVAHNPAGIAVPAETISESPFSNLKFNIIFGAMKDKDITGMLKSLSTIYSKMFFTEPAIDRAAMMDDLVIAASDSGISNYILIQSPVEAYKTVMNLNEPLIIAGSFYLAGDLAEVLKIIEI